MVVPGWGRRLPGEEGQSGGRVPGTLMSWYLAPLICKLPRGLTALVQECASGAQLGGRGAQ